MVISQVQGSLLESYGRVDIFSGFPYNLYLVKDLAFSVQEQKLYDLLSKAIIHGHSNVSAKAGFNSKEMAAFFDEFQEKVVNEIYLNYLNQRFVDSKLFSKILSDFSNLLQSIPFVIKPDVLADEILNDAVGYKKIGVFLKDDLLEEIMINGYNRPVFVFHNRFGVCKTNIMIEERGFLNELIGKIAFTVEKNFDEKNPLLDARLPDGSRVNATFQQVTPIGHTLTIRKFGKNALSLVNLIEFGTLNSELAAFLWILVEGMRFEPMNIIVTGGTSSGKTVLLNVLSIFIPYTERVITIEDTLELSLGNRENWIQMESRPKIGNSIEVSMDDLLKNALRMRPDRLIVGEVRGGEARTIFTAMDTGHSGCMGTMHSNTAREMLVRLKTEPMAVPESMLPLLNVAIVMQRFYDPHKGLVRRIKEVTELARMEDQVLLANLFEYDRAKDKVLKTDLPSHVMELFSERLSMTKNEVKQELFVRKSIIDWMVLKGISNTGEVEEIIQKYYIDPHFVLEQISKAK